MLILMKPDATTEQVDYVKDKIREMGFRAHEIPGYTDCYRYYR